MKFNSMSKTPARKSTVIRVLAFLVNLRTKIIQQISGRSRAGGRVVKGSRRTKRAQSIKERLENLILIY